VPFPQVLEQLNQNLDWTQQIGYAMATQQEDVFDSVQRLRRQAQQAGHLKTTEQQVVSTQATVDDQGQPAPDPAIVIQPADPQVVYVPAYNPSVVYGTWPYPGIRPRITRRLPLITAAPRWRAEWPLRPSLLIVPLR
jgi:hypothetical protein